MAVIYEKQLPGGGCIRLFDDYLPKTDEERRSAHRDFERTAEMLISTGQLKVDGVSVGDKVKCTLVRRESEE